jgi:3-hydroxybutyryl-CoA dehydrogenase
MAQRISIVGGGLMGHGIALVFAAAGHDVRITDPVAEVRARIRDRIGATLDELGNDRAALDHIALAETLEACVADAQWVIEAAPEDLALKQRIFADIENAAPADAVLASNTSVIPIGQIMARIGRKQRALGTHWWNPPYLVPLVEVIGTEQTSDAVLTGTLNLLSAIGKIPVHVRRDIAGFIGNRLQHALWREAIALVADGVCDAATIDLVVKNSFGMRLGILGPMENADLVGLDLTRAIHGRLFPDLARDMAPNLLLETLVEEGRLGMKTGRGFLDWPVDTQEQVRASLIGRLRYPGGASGAPAQTASAPSSN